MVRRIMYLSTLAPPRPRGEPAEPTPPRVRVTYAPDASATWSYAIWLSNRLYV